MANGLLGGVPSHANGCLNDDDDDHSIDGDGDDNNNGPLIFIIVMMTTMMEFISDFNFKIVCVINVCDFALFNAACRPYIPDLP